MTTTKQLPQTLPPVIHEVLNIPDYITDSIGRMRISFEDYVLPRVEDVKGWDQFNAEVVLTDRKGTNIEFSTSVMITVTRNHPSDVDRCGPFDVRVTIAPRDFIQYHTGLFSGQVKETTLYTDSMYFRSRVEAKIRETLYLKSEEA